MLRRSRSFPIMLFLLVSLLLTLPIFVHAQDVTPSDDTFITNTPLATVVATVNGTPVEATLIAPTATPAPILTPDNTISISTLIYGLIIAILGGGTVGAVINRFGGSKVNQDAMEKLYLAQSPDAQERERQLFEALRDITLRVLDYVDKVTDGLPNQPTAQLATIEGPALAKQSDLDMLSKQIAIHQKYYPLPDATKSAESESIGT